MPRTLIGNFKGPKGSTGEQGIQGPPGPQGLPGEKGEPGAVDENTPIIFEAPEEYEAPKSGNAIKVLFGKIAKGLSNLFAAIGVLASLKTVNKSTLVAAINELAEGKLDIAKIVASTNITEPGFLMDGKTASEAFTELYSNMIIFRRSISPGEDLNDIITPGLYSIYSSAAPQVKNLPINSACVIEILVSSEYIIQKEYSLSASKTRFRSSDKWFDWY